VDPESPGERCRDTAGLAYRIDTLSPQKTFIILRFLVHYSIFAFSIISEIGMLPLAECLRLPSNPLDLFLGFLEFVVFIAFSVLSLVLVCRFWLLAFST